MTGVHEVDGLLSRWNGQGGHGTPCVNLLFLRNRGLLSRCECLFPGYRQWGF